METLVISVSSSTPMLNKRIQQAKNKYINTTVNHIYKIYNRDMSSGGELGEGVPILSL